MRILFDSKLPQHKRPFGCLTPGEECTLSVHIPVAVMTRKAEMVLCGENGGELCSEELHFEKTVGPYEYWTGSFRLEKTGLYFYYFRITDPHGTFRLFKEGDDTNMEAGDYWQLSCVEDAYPVPEALRGTYAFSKRTAAYATLGALRNDGNARFSPSVGVSNTALAPVAGQNQTGLMVGLRHAF